MLSILAFGFVVLGAAFGYWAIVVTEGAYFGRRLVTFLYDRGAETYDEVKAFDLAEDALFLGIPMARDLEDLQQPLVLDIATGTGRMALSLMRQLTFGGHVVALDISRDMLEMARRKTRPYQDRMTFVRRDATVLPFADACFDAVSCVEALEFLPSPTTTLREMVRVLRPGGSFLVTNRIGWERHFLPGRAFRSDKFEAMLTELGLIEVWTKPWQTYYDLIWARKPGLLEDRGTPPAIPELLRCPGCGGRVGVGDTRVLACTVCRTRFSWCQGIVDFERNWEDTDGIQGAD